MEFSKKLASIFEGRTPKKSNFVLSEVTKISPDSKGHSGEGSMPMVGGGEMGGWTRWENAQNALEKGQAAVQKAMENPDMDDKLRSKLDKVVERMSSAAGQLSRQGKLTPEMAKSTMGALSGLAQSGGKSSAALQKAMVGMKNYAGEAGVPAEEMSEYNKVADKYAQQVEKEATPADEPPEDPEQPPTEMPDKLEVGDKPEGREAPDYEGETDKPDPRTTGPEKPVGTPLDPYGGEEEEFTPPDKEEDPQIADIASKMDDEGETDVLDPYAGEDEEDDSKVAPDEDEDDAPLELKDEEPAPDEEEEAPEDEPLDLADEKPGDEKETDWENDPRVGDIASQMDDEGEPDILDPYAGEGEEDDNKVAPDEDEEDAPLELKDEEPSEKPETDWENDPRLAGTGDNFDGETGERLNTDLAQELAGNKPELREPEPEAPPVAAQPAPVAAQPAPVAAQPAPVAAQPAPVAAQPAPVAAQPAPVAAQPAPVAAQPAPAAPAAEPGAAPQPAAPAAQPAAPPQGADANVEILKQGGDSALVRVRGKENGKAVYKYLIINAADLEKTTQDPTFSPQNVWQHIGVSLRDPDFLKNFKNSAQAALADFQHTSTEEPPKNADEFIRRAVGKTHRDMLLNAIQRSGNKDLAEIAATLSNTQVAQLLEQYPEVRNADIPDEQVQQYMNTLERQFSPQMEGKELDDVLLEVGFLKRLGGKLKRGARSLQSKMGLDTEMYAKQGLRYDMLAKAMAADPQKMSQALQKIGVDTTQFPQLQGLQPTSAQDALGQPEGAAPVLDPGDDDMGDLSQDLDAEPGSPEDLAAEPMAQQAQQQALQQAQREEGTVTRGDVQQAAPAVQAAQALVVWLAKAFKRQLTGQNRNLRSMRGLLTRIYALKLHALLPTITLKQH
jgi:hypothetical protein